MCSALKVPVGLPAVAFNTNVPLTVCPFRGLQITTVRVAGAGQAALVINTVIVWLIVPWESVALNTKVLWPTGRLTPTSSQDWLIVSGCAFAHCQVKLVILFGLATTA